MGVINRTPDSFSDGGLYLDEAACLKRVEELVDSGADIIDIGGESTRPGAKSVSEKEELRRVLPIIKKVANKIKVPISIDTTKSGVAKRALAEGAVIVNDISGLRRDPKMAKLVAQAKAGLIIMHSKGTPRTMQKNPRYKALVPEILRSLRNSLRIAQEAGVESRKIIVDPGIGFGKTVEHNLEILNRLNELKALGRPIAIGTSRKSFIGNILGVTVEERLFGTAATVTWAISKGANIIRVHDVKEMAQVAKMVDSITQINTDSRK